MITIIDWHSPLTFCILGGCVIVFALVYAIFLDWMAVRVFRCKIKSQEEETKKPFDEKP